MDDREWDSACKAAFFALYAAMKLCHKIGMNPHDLLDMLRDRLKQDGCIMADGSIVVKEERK